VSFWDEAQFVVTDAPLPAGGGSLGVAPGGMPTSGPPPSPGAPSNVVASSPAGGFRMTRDEMDSTRQKAEALLDQIQRQQAASERLSNIQSPADEPVSNGVTATLNNAGEYYQGHLRRQVAYLEVVIDKMRQALGMVSLAEENSQKMLQQTGEGSIF
jgi:hypothetical protein